MKASTSRPSRNGLALRIHSALNTDYEIGRLSASPTRRFQPIANTKMSTDAIKVVAGYGANTNPGLVRDYNEDRVAIILNIMKP